MRLGIFIVILFLMVAFNASSYSAPVGLTSESDATISSGLFGENDMGIEPSISFVGDSVTIRKIDIEKGELEFNAFMAKIGLNLAKNFNLYIDIGQIRDIKYLYSTLGENHKICYDEEPIWGVGLNGLIYRWSNGLEIGAHASYRQADLKLNSVNADNTIYQKTAISNISEDTFKEYQAGIEVAWKETFMIPYIGAKYSDVEVGSDYIIHSQQYNSKEKNSVNNFGVFVGLSIIPKLDFLSSYGTSTQPLLINLEGRFLDEEAFTIEISYRF